MKALPAALMLSVLVLRAPVVSAEETLEEIKAHLNVQPDAWREFGPGSWVELRYMPLSGPSTEPTEFRQTLVSRVGKNVTLEFQMVTRTVDAAGKETIVLGKAQTVTQPTTTEGTAWEDLKELRKEEIEIGDRKVACRVIEATRVTPLPDPVRGQTELRTKTTLWISSEVMKEWGGLVKTKGGFPVGGALGGLSYDLKVKELDRKVKLGDRTVTCYVYDYVSIPKAGEPIVSGEVCMSPEVPNGVVSGMFGTSPAPQGPNAPHKPTMDMKYEAIDMKIVKPK